MQEVHTPTPSKEQRPCRNRYIAVLIATTFAASVALIWLITITLQATRSDNLFGYLFLGICFILTLAVTSWVFIPGLRQASKLEELLAEFVEYSDKFTRPRIYVHRSTNIPNELREPKDFALFMMATSNGTLMMPRVPTGNNNSMNEEYSLCLNLNDELYVIQNTGYLADDGLHKAVCSSLRNDPLTVHIRLTPLRKQSKVPHGDFKLEGFEAEAFLKTLKLARFFSLKRRIPFMAPAPRPHW